MDTVKHTNKDWNSFSECNTRKTQKEQRFNKSHPPTNLENYARAFQTCEVQSNQVLYESFSTRGMLGSPYSIFKKLMEKKEFAHLEHLWVLHNFAENSSSIKKYEEYPNVHFICYESTAYFCALASAKYLINDLAFPSYFTKKEGQIYVNIWPDTTDCDVPHGNIETANTLRNFLCADYLISANEKMTDMYLDAYHLRGILPGKIVEKSSLKDDSPKESIEDFLQKHSVVHEELAEISGEMFLIQNVSKQGPNRMRAQLIPLPPKHTANFVSIGEMTASKKHLTLIRAFARFRQKYPDTCLYILGDGPLRREIEQEVQKQDLEKRVFLPGHISNPLAVLKRCQCFISPSSHESQPMDLLAALIMRMPILLSSLSNMENCLIPNEQMLISPTIDGIINGLTAFMNGNVTNDYIFDIKQFNRETLEKFIAAIR